MNDEQMQPLLDSWFRDREVAPTDVQAGVAEVMADVPQTRQQRRWRPFSLFDRKAQASTATDTTKYRSSPIPATNGHAPIVIGRTKTMLSPVKAITAGALVFALGGAFLITQPFDQQGEAVPGAETPEPTSVQVTVTQQCNDVGHSGCDWTASDPRLTGRVALHFGESVAVEGAEDFEAGWQWIAQLFNGPEGGWTGHAYALWGEPTQNFLVLSGNRAFEGWHYLASGTDPEPDGDFEWIGTLYEGELPPFPAPPAE